MNLRTLGAIGIATVLAAPLAFAAHPLQTEDTGTQGDGNLEWENGVTRALGGGVDTWVYAPQWSLGLGASVDLILQPSWVRAPRADGRRVSGPGDTNLDAKWRFYGAAPISFGVRAGLALPTARGGLGLPHGEVSPHAVLVMTIDAAPLVVHVNAGLTQNPGGSGLRQRTNVASAAAMWSVDEKLILTTELASTSNADRGASGRVGTGLAGVIYTVRPGLDLDTGWQLSRGGAPASHALLVGLTWRFAL